MRKVFAILNNPQECGNITLSFFDIESGELLKILDFGDIYDQRIFYYNSKVKKFEECIYKDRTYIYKDRTYHPEDTYDLYLYGKFNGDLNAMISYFAKKYGYQVVIPERVTESKLESLTEAMID